MGLRGPPPTPTPILEARGSWRAAEREGEVKFDVAAPACPSFLGKEARAEWRRQVKQLAAAGVLQAVDRAALACWCEAWGEFRRLAEAIESRVNAAANAGAQDGEDDPLAVSPRLLRARDSAVDRLLRLAGQFGFTPAARVRIKAPSGEREARPDNGKARFFSTVG